MAERWVTWRRFFQILVVVPACFCVLGLSGCSDHDAKSDLAVDNQKLQTGDVQIDIMPDSFPNVAHKCRQQQEGTVGLWTTTDRLVILVYNDWACPTANLEQPMFVISNVIGQVARQAESAAPEG